MNSLADSQCNSCANAVGALDQASAAGLLAELGNGWAIVDGGRLEKSFQFKNFRDALSFTNQVGEVAEAAGHHPDIYLAWGKVRLIIFTHKVNGLTRDDFVLAAKLSALTVP